MKNQIIPIIQQDGQSAVDARELHAYLGNGDMFANWIKDRITQFGLIENQDYTTYLENSKKGRPCTEYALSLDCAKQLAMVERNDKGREARLYFIECEKELKQARPIGPQPTTELVELIRQAILVTGSQGKLGARIGVSPATLSQILHAKPWQYSPEILHNIAVGCRNVIAMPVVSTDYQVLTPLVNIDNKAERVLLYNTLKKGGVL